MENKNNEESIKEAPISFSETPATSSPVTVGEWMWTTLVAGIPFVGLVMLFVWAFSKAENPSKANWAKATLLWMLIIGLIMALFFILFLSVFSSQRVSTIPY